MKTPAAPYWRIGEAELDSGLPIVDYWDCAAEDLGGGAAKYVAFKFFQGAGANWAGTGLGVIGNTVSGAIEGVAEGVLAPVAAAATVGQLTVHAGCAISAAF